MKRCLAGVLPERMRAHFFPLQTGDHGPLRLRGAGLPKEAWAGAGAGDRGLPNTFPVEPHWETAGPRSGRPGPNSDIGTKANTRWLRADGNAPSSLRPRAQGWAEADLWGWPCTTHTLQSVARPQVWPQTNLREASELAFRFQGACSVGWRGGCGERAGLGVKAAPQRPASWGSRASAYSSVKWGDCMRLSGLHHSGKSERTGYLWEGQDVLRQRGAE